MSWWDERNPAPQHEPAFTERLAENSLLLRARTEGTDFQLSAYGYGNPESLIAELIELVPEIQKVLESTTIHGTTTHHFAWGGGYAAVSADSDGDMRFFSITGDPTAHVALSSLVERHVHRKPTEKGTVFAVVRTMQGLGLHTVGAVDAPFSAENYSDDAVRDYAHVLDCLTSKEPCGRLVLLEGPPGTGKSYMIRALAGAVEATFVLVGSSLVGEISGPEVLPVLLQARDQAGKGHPIVLILEDADAALVRRERGDLCRVSDVLNLGDGLLGELVDVRVIATSNAGHMDLDPAVVRPGRMCRHVRVGALGKDGAASLYHNLTGNVYGTPFDQEASLADVYRAARSDGWTPPRRNGSYRPGDYR